MEFPKIYTLYVRNALTHKVEEPFELRNPVYGCITEWDWTEKIDGINIRLMWDPVTQSVEIGGRTDNANIPARLYQAILENIDFKRLSTLTRPTIIFGEGYGPGIQKIGSQYGLINSFIVFDVLINEQYWLKLADTQDIATKLGFEHAPYYGRADLDTARRVVREGIRSRIPGATCNMEGLVGRPVRTLYDERHKRLICKLKTRDFV